MKTIVDSIHGQMAFSTVIMEIINTTEFQRLKSLKQLGVTHYVIPSVTHTRFEHSLGVCHLAGKLMDTLERNSGIVVPTALRNCVQIAGLLHDIGHGPFSHAWEHFVHMGTDENWTHEESSCRMVEYLFEINPIRLANNDAEHFYCIDLIKSLIVGDKDAWLALLEPKFWFITEIVNNKFCFIDVDKWDYLLRDAHYLRNAFDNFHQDFAAFFDGARVTADTDFVTHISYHVDDYNLIYEMLENRSNFHINCYQHPTTLGVELLIFDALRMAEESGFLFKGCKLSEAQKNNAVYTHLDDTIINLVLSTEDPKLFKARQLLKRIVERKLYKIVWSGERPLNIVELNEKFGKYFVMKHKKIPYAGQILPPTVLLHNGNGNIVKPEITFPKGYYEEYIVFCTADSPDIVERVKTYLEQNPPTL